MRGIVHYSAETFSLTPYRNLWLELCNIKNLKLAYKKARKGKTTTDYVLLFENNLSANLQELRQELLFHYYRPKPLQTFILRDPKTRKISKSEFRDRVIHHALCNIIEPLFEERFIFDSYANRIGKGTLKAIEQFCYFSKKITKNNTIRAFVLKADIKHYFETVNPEILLRIIGKKIRDPRVLWLIKTILANYSLGGNSPLSGLGMPLGNLTSQFFANVYLNELDQFVKHELKIKYYIRYVDDFVLFNESRTELEKFMVEIGLFVKKNLALELHPDKSKILPLHRGVNFLGLKIFPFHKLVKKKNISKFKRKLNDLCEFYSKGQVSYDQIYDFLEGWLAYAKYANTYKFSRKILKDIEQKFNHEISTKEVNRSLKYQ